MTKRVRHPDTPAPAQRRTVVSAEALEAALQRKGLKRSNIRFAILEAFVACDGHVSAEELTRRVRDQLPQVSLPTVYRTLNVLVSSGLAAARAFGDGHTRFEPSGSIHHDHLICTRCKRVVEFEDEEIERVQDELARRLGFEISSHTLELYGACTECRGSP